jgi:predicted transposase YdaD
LDLETLKLDKTEYIDSKLRTSFSDVVYDCRYGEKGKVKISLLFEHKSKPERFPQLQLWDICIKFG